MMDLVVSWYINVFLKNISHKQFAEGRRDIDLSTLVSCFNTKLLFPVYHYNGLLAL